MKIRRIGIVGSGNIGGTLGTLLGKAGYEVFFSSRHPENLKELVEAAGPAARAGKVTEAIAFGDVVILSIPLKGYRELDTETKQALKGKIVLDTSNPYPERDGTIADEARKDPGGMGSFVARLIPGTRMVRAFNTVYFEDLRKTVNNNGEKIGIPIASDDQEALDAAVELAQKAGARCGSGRRPEQVQALRRRHFSVCHKCLGAGDQAETEDRVKRNGQV